MYRVSLVVAFCVVMISAVASSQTAPCPIGVASSKLLCLVPQVFGPSGLVLPAGGGAPPALVNSFNGNSLTPLNSAIAGQSVALPLASPSSGITYAWDSVAKVPVLSTDSFGPIFSERAETIGKYRLSLGLAYQHFQFSRLDGTSLKNLPEVFTQPDIDLGGGNVCSLTGDSTGQCAPIRDVVTVKNRIDLAIQQVTTFMTFGITDRIDVSAAIPVQSISMSIFSDATIVNNSNSPVHAFASHGDCGQNGTNCLNQPFSSVGHASGIGDIILRVKGTVWKGERAAVALGTDVRLPTGDSLNFLGAGAVGVRPFVVWSYKARISPHLGAGFQANGSSRVTGDVTTGAKERLPGEITYSAGADVWLNRRVTAAFDILGQTVFQSLRLKPTTFTEPGACLQPFPSCMGPPFATPNIDPNLAQSTGNFNTLDASIGVKVRLVSHLLLTGNVVFRTDDSGLRAKPVPMVQLGYTF